ncbi:Crp/Fnr family transcriptional regulator [Crocinitomix catalasitica]|uniref:Crp/Fnr family transcriptional regulator n=1 Tax=Crocinitomix catalasitica TaxID=184607 RepID=UPI0006869D8C|nr:Crp/Fnr family transcriptional regulator [Crocinitomix catalasitica]
MKNLNHSNTQTIVKGELLSSPGKIAKNGYFVKTGCLKSYIIDSEGKEHIIQFAPEHWMIGDLNSFTFDVPSEIYVEAIEDSEITLISKSEYQNLDLLEKEEVIEMSNKYRNNLIASNKRVISLLSSTAEQRYIDFTETYPTLVQRLRLKLIASYIGVTPEYLSEIRRKLVKK